MLQRLILLLLSFSLMYGSDNPTGGGKWGFIKPYAISAAKTAGKVLLAAVVPTEYKPPFARYRTQSAPPQKTEAPSLEMTNREPVIGGTNAQDQFLKPGELYDEKTGEIYRKDGRPRNQPGSSSAPSDSVSYSGSAGGQNVSVGVQKGGILNAMYDGVNYLFGSSAKDQARDREIEAFNKEMDAKIPKHPSQSPGVVQDAQKKLNARLNAIPNYTDAELDRRQRLAESSKEAELYNPSGTTETYVDILNKEITAIQQEKMRRQAKTTVTHATAMLLTSQTVGTASTEKATTVTTEEQRLHDLIKAREAQSEKWKNSFWPSEWVSVHTAREYEKVTQTEKQKLAALKWEKAKEQHHKNEGEKYQENSKKMTEHRNNGGGGNGGGDKDPEKDPMGPVKAGVGTGLVRETRKGNEHPEAPKPQQSAQPKTKAEKKQAEREKAQAKAREGINTELNKPYHESGKLPEFDTDQNRKIHIWRDEGGHFNTQTEKSKQAMLDIVKEHGNYIGENFSGNQVYAGSSKLCDGKQVWVHTRNGKIVDAGINETSWTRDQILTSKRPPEAKNDKSLFYTLAAGAGLEAIASSTPAEASEIRAKLSAPLIVTKMQELKLPDAPSSDFKLPDAPADVKPHFSTQPNAIPSLGLDMSKLDTSVFTKSPIGATSNKEILKLSPSTVAILNKTPSPSSLKSTDSKPSVPTLTLPSAPPAAKPSMPSSFKAPTSTPKLSLPTSSSKPSSTSSYKPSSSSSSYKPGSISGYKPSGSTGGYNPTSFSKKN